MSWRNPSLAFIAAACLLQHACLDTGTESLDVPLALAGTEVATVTSRDGWQLELDTAELVVGPVVLCASPTAGELCDTARAEWLDSAVVNLLQSRAKAVGTLVGSEGAVRSIMLDFGYANLLTWVEPAPLHAVQELGGSLRLHGTASRDANSIEFDSLLALRRGPDTEQGVPLVRASLSPAHDVTRESQLTLRFNVVPWLESLSFDAYLVEASCDEPCSLEIELAPDSPAARALQTEILSGARPSLEWTESAEN